MLQHFRNLGVQELRFPPEGVAIIGDNGQGKTNLLEAIYYLESFRSFRGASDTELAAFTEDVFHIKASVDGAEPTTVAAGFDRKRKKKKVSVDGNDIRRISAALGRLGAVVFSPADVGLVSGGPHWRRRFLDIVLSLNRSGYMKAIQGYRQALGQRNAALKAKGGSAAVRAWDDVLVERGTRVTRFRYEWADTWGEPFSAYYAAISGGDPGALAYKPNLGDGSKDHGTDGMSADSVRERFRKRLEEGWETDSRRGVTGAGPHRDELLFTIRPQGRCVPARVFGSGGQRRTAALALRLTEAATIRRQRGAEPILLLDDAFAELDPGRSERVMSLMEEEGTGQVILTAPKESDVRMRSSSLVRWRIRDGTVQA